MHRFVVPAVYRRTDTPGRILVDVMKEDMGMSHEIMVAVTQVMLAECIAVIVAAVVFGGRDTNHPEKTLGGRIPFDGIPELLDLGGSGLDQTGIKTTYPPLPGFPYLSPEFNHLLKHGVLRMASNTPLEASWCAAVFALRALSASLI